VSGRRRASSQQPSDRDASYARNVDALTAVLPRWLTYDEIRIELGSPWVTSGDIEQFCREELGASYTATVEMLSS
jgi:N12 class adenine-specific DNA methylase